MRKSLSLILSALLLLFTTVPAAAQSPTLFGVVTDRDGRPVAGAEVEVYGLGEGLVQVLYTSSNGAFSLNTQGDDPLLWQIRVWAKDYRTYESGWFDLMQQRYQSVRLDALTGALQVTVRDESGAPLQGTLNLIGPGGRLIGQYDVVDGQFSKDGLEPGSYRIVVSAPGMAPQSQNLTVASNMTATAAVTLKKAGFTVTGEVRDAADNDPVWEAHVELLRADMTQVATATTTSDGRFFFAAPDELPGTYLVRATAADYRTTLTSAFQVEAGHGYDLSGTNAVTLQPLTASLTGQVLDEDGDPLKRAKVALLLQGYGVVGEDKTDSRGNFSFDNLMVGSAYKYTVLPLVDDLTFEPQWTALTAGSTNQMVLRGQDLDGSTSESGTISGIVTTASGEPIRNARVELWLGNGEEETAKTNADGAFLFKNVDATVDETDPTDPQVEIGRAHV